MPGYYDWKIRNCTDGAITKAESLNQTMEMVDVRLHKIWDENGKSFPADVDQHLAEVVALIDEGEEALEKAKLHLAKLFEGCPKT